MGTHPIFESDFDCLTEGYELNSVKLRRFEEKLRKIIPRYRIWSNE